LKLNYFEAKFTVILAPQIFYYSYYTQFYLSSQMKHLYLESLYRVVLIFL